MVVDFRLAPISRIASSGVVALMISGSLAVHSQRDTKGTSLCSLLAVMVEFWLQNSAICLNAFILEDLSEAKRQGDEKLYRCRIFDKAW